MKSLNVALPALALAIAMPAESAPCSPLLAHKVNDILGQPHDLCEHAGKVVLVVNTASFCGYTPQYQGTGERPQWNFHKYLVGRDGRTAASFKSAVEPESPQFIAKVEELLK